MADAGQLTAAEVRAMLERAGVDCSALEIRDDPAVWHALGTGRAHTNVVVSGPGPPREAAALVLLLRYGLSMAPYPDHDEWSRR